jgi:DNA-binding transcriptional LysR family regulator
VSKLDGPNLLQLTVDEEIISPHGVVEADFIMTPPTLQALEAFLTTARLGSFRGAAAERGVTPSALSHLIRSLEESLGVRLFHRTTRSVALTEAGLHLRDGIERPLDAVSQALRAVSSFGSVPAGTVRLNVPRVASQLFLESTVPRFLARHPEIRLEITTNDRLVDIVAGGFDAGIRRDRRLAPGMIAIPIGPARRFAVIGAPSYFERHGVPHVPDDLHGHRCIGWRLEDGTRYAWEFTRGDEVIELDVTGPLVADDTRIMLRAAAEGIGLAFILEDLAADRIAAGEFVRVLGDWCPASPRYYLYYSGRHRVPPALKAFIAFLRDADVPDAELRSRPNAATKRSDAADIS